MNDKRAFYGLKMFNYNYNNNFEHVMVLVLILVFSVNVWNNLYFKHVVNMIKPVNTCCLIKPKAIVFVNTKHGTC